MRTAMRTGPTFQKTCAASPTERPVAASDGKEGRFLAAPERGAFIHSLWASLEQYHLPCRLPIGRRWPRCPRSQGRGAQAVVCDS